MAYVGFHSTLGFGTEVNINKQETKWPLTELGNAAAAGEKVLGGKK